LSRSFISLLLVGLPSLRLVLHGIKRFSMKNEMVF
jgi:hypothetical protein